MGAVRRARVMLGARLGGGVDPVTGDRLSAGERLSWLMQGLIRRWLFLGAITGVTAAVWATRDPTALVWWNLGASYLALVVESLVGIAMFGQTKRDAVVLRRVDRNDEATRRLLEELLNLKAHVGEIHAATAGGHIPPRRGPGGRYRPDVYVPGENPRDG